MAFQMLAPQDGRPLAPRLNRWNVAEPLWRKEMKGNLNRALQSVVPLATVLGLFATTAFCQALPRASVAVTQHSLRAQDFLLTRDSFLAPVRASSRADHTAGNGFLRNSELTRQVRGFHFASYKSSRTLEDLLAVRTNDTVFVSQSRVPLVHFWGGRLQIAGISSTVKMGNVLLGPSAQGALQSLRLTQQARFSAAHSIDLYGISVGFRLTPLAESAGRAPIWRVLESIRE
jgi:hypothetical protein